MHYYIDGYNLLFRILRAGDDLTKQRETIIEDLSHKIALLGIDATLVFDSQYQLGESTRSHLRNLEILYTDYQQTADDLILKELKREPNPQQHTVVTSDKKLAWYARRKSAKTETVEEFFAWLNKAYKNKLRHQKQAKESPKEIPKKKETPVKPAQPSTQASANECFDFYLQQFEKEAEALTPPTSPSPPEKEPKRRSKIPKKAKDDAQSLMDHWLKAFQSNPDPDPDPDEDDFGSR